MCTIYTVPTSKKLKAELRLPDGRESIGGETREVYQEIQCYSKIQGINSDIMLHTRVREVNNDCILKIAERGH